MHRPLIALTLFFLASTTHGATPTTQPTPLTIPLWLTVPNAPTNPAPERDDGTGRIWNVSNPSMLVYLPPADDNTAHPAIIFCPGGSYTHLTRLEGADGFVPLFLPQHFAVISLKYRLRPVSTDVERDAHDDALRAIRILRAHAAEWHLDPQRIGLAGASAGGNLTLNVASKFDPGSPAAPDPIDHQSSRPDFVLLLSPWPDAHSITDYPIPQDAPPAFICSARDDHTAPTAFAQAIADAYEAHRIPHQLWLVDIGGHGAFTLNTTGEGAHWPDHFLPWLHSLEGSK